MTDEEKYIIQGRTRDEAKRLREEVATLRQYFEHYSDTLDGVKDAIRRFLADPSQKFPGDRLAIDVVNGWQRQLCKPGFFEESGNFMEKTRKLKDLEERIKEF